MKLHILSGQTVEFLSQDSYSAHLAWRQSLFILNSVESQSYYNLCNRK
jgi:hypothetical protein